MAEEYLMALSQGYRLNQYEIMKVLGAGGFGVTYLARDTSLDKLIAIKEYMPSDFALRTDGSRVTAKSTSTTNDYQWGLARFLEEARILAKFRHPHIVEVHQIFEANQTAYIIMEYAEGETLSQHLDRVGTLNEATMSVVLGPILDGLQKVHALGFLHRDIKPSNIILRAQGGPVLIDFGAARQAVEAKSRSITSIVTEGYAPIEQYASSGHQGTWTDVYALGAVAYRCLTGQTPLAATQRIRSDPMPPASTAAAGRASPHFLAAVDWALLSHEGDRPQTIAEWLPALQGTVDAEKTIRARNIDATMRSAETSYALSRVQPSLLVPQPHGAPHPHGGPQPPTHYQHPQPTPVHGNDPFSRFLGAGSRSPMQLVAATALVVILLGVGGWWFFVGRIPQDDRLAWAAASSANTVESYEAYVRVQPNGYYVSDAKDKIAEVSASADDTAWSQAIAQNTAAAYQGYMQQYPAGRHLPEAKAGMIGAARAELIVRAQQGLSMAGFYKGPADGKETAVVTVALRSYQRSKGMPETGTIDEATLAALDQDNAERLRIKREQEARELAAYNRALSSRSRGVYEDFLRNFASSAHAAEIRTHLASCRPVMRTQTVVDSKALTEKGTGRGTGNEGCRLAQQQATQKLAARCTGHLSSLVVLAEDHDTTGSETGSAILSTILGVVAKRTVNVNLPSTCNTELRAECQTSRSVQRQQDVCD